MIFTTCPPAEAIGGLLAHAITLNGRRIAKATPVTPILAAAAAHLPSLTIVRLDPHDVAEDAAAAALADALTGPDLRAAPPLHGRVNLHATRAGLFLATDVTAVNAVDESLTLATLPPFMPVAADQVVATIKIIPFAVAAATLAAATLAATPLALAPWRGGTAHLIHTTPMPAKVIAKTSAVTGARVAALGMTLTQGPPIPHDGVSLADALAAAPPSALILVAGATATADRADVIPAAILAVGGTLIRVGMPADPGNLLVLGQLGSTPVIGLPGCARSPKRNGLDLVLERLAAGLAVTSADIAAMGAGGLLDEAAAALPLGLAMTIGVILLAAGRARRMGHSKLTALVDGQPLIAHSLAAITAAGLPCLIVTGAHADAVHAALRPGIATTHAPDHADGQSASLRAGLAAAPDQWTGALIALGDMPLIQPATYAALATALAAASAVIPSYQGRPGNPAGFRRPLWPILMTLTGDRGARPLFGTTLPHPLDIPVNDPGILHDIDTPADLADLTRPDALRSPATAPRTPGSPRSPGRSR